MQLFFEDTIDDAKYCGRLYGLGTGVAQKQSEDVEAAQEKMSILAIINNLQQWQQNAVQQNMGPWGQASSLKVLHLKHMAEELAFLQRAKGIFAMNLGWF